MENHILESPAAHLSIGIHDITIDLVANIGTFVMSFNLLSIQLIQFKSKHLSLAYEEHCKLTIPCLSRSTLMSNPDQFPNVLLLFSSTACLLLFLDLSATIHNASGVFPLQHIQCLFFYQTCLGGWLHWEAFSVLPGGTGH